MIRFNRIHNPNEIDNIFIQNELNEGKNVIIQFSSASYTDKMLYDINELCSKNGERLDIRFYGHNFDCKIVKKIPEVKSLYLDCLLRVENIASLTQLSKLKKLALGIYELRDTEILSAEIFKNLSELIIGGTKIKSLNLQYLEEYQSLKKLIVIGHTKKIDAIGQIKNLESLSLNSVSKVPIHFVNKLKKLKTLNFILGGRDNINEIEENEIEKLEIVWVRGFCDFSNILNFRKLKQLKIEDQIRLPKMSFEQQFPELIDLKILNCKTFYSLTGIENLSSLYQLRIYKTNIDFDLFIQQKFPPSLKIFAFYTTKKLVDSEIQKTLEGKGYSDGLPK